MSRVYVVTGAASGIGAATCALLRDRGKEVIGVDIHNSDVNADLSTVEGRDDAISDVINLCESKGGIHSKLDAIIACAGLATPSPKTVSVNFYGVTQFVEGLLPVLSKSPTPRVAVTSSMASLMPNSPELVEALLTSSEQEAIAIAQKLCDSGAEQAALIYASTKRALSRWVRRESIKPAWAGAGIPLNAVGPGIVETPMVEEMIGTAESRAAIDLLVPMPLNYYMEPIKVAYLLSWLTDKNNTHITGQTIYIDGGADAVLRGDDIWA
jgi:NAD(P)-dependent dehydrogenase (short-subunit alcohol dehydrogenase family)